MKYIKNFTIKSSDDVQTTRCIEFVASDNSVDSANEVVPVDLWDLDRYNKNGIVIYQHNGYYSSDPDMVIGKGIARIEDGKLIIAVTFEPKEINPLAEKIFQKILFGSISAGSVGFKPTKRGHYGDEKKGENPRVYYYEGQELLEFSIVNIPANPNAVARRSLEEMSEAERAELFKEFMPQEQKKEEEPEQQTEGKSEKEPETPPATTEESEEKSLESELIIAMAIMNI